MINSVRQTVLSVLNKNNYGYITPADFNLYAKQAQLEVFDQYMYDYNYQVNKENARQSGTDYANIGRSLAEGIDTFSVTKPLKKTVNSVIANLNNFYLPSVASTGEDYYMINKVLVYSSVASGTNNVLNTKQLIDTSQPSWTAPVSVGDLVVNSTTENFAYVTAVNGPQTLTLTDDIFTNGDPFQNYRVLSGVKVSDRITHDKITTLNASLYTQPSTIFPAHSEANDFLTIFPSTITAYGQVVAQYIRYPKEPRWTYTTLANAEPVFDSTQADFQDFEVPADDEYTLVQKILGYAGMSIREIEVVKFGQGKEQAETLSEK